jgi:hypothetical protein
MRLYEHPGNDLNPSLGIHRHLRPRKVPFAISALQLRARVIRNSDYARLQQLHRKLGGEFGPQTPRCELLVDLFSIAYPS